MAKDKYANRAFMQVIESAANTLTFSMLQTGVTLFAKTALIIHEIAYWWSDRDDLVASEDYLQVAVTTSNKMTGISAADPGVVDMRQFHNLLSGAAATRELYELPSVRDFTGMPSGGLIVPAYPIFLAAEGVSLGNPQTVSARMLYTVVELKADEYIELVEALRMLE